MNNFSQLQSKIILTIDITQCDLVTPRCGRCSRLNIECVGSASRRFKFEFCDPNTTTQPNNEQQLVQSIPRSPSNETTIMATALIHILEVKNLGYDIRAFGIRLMSGLPLEIGKSQELDTCISGLVALYKNTHSTPPSSDALVKYGRALKVTRMSLENPSASVALKLKLITILGACQVSFSHNPR